MSQPEDIYEWMEKQKWPLNRAGVRKVSIAKLAEMRRVGVKFVELLLYNASCPEEECAPFQAICRKKIPIENAQPLPLPGCDKEHCKCIWIAREP